MRLSRRWDWPPETTEAAAYLLTPKVWVFLHEVFDAKRQTQKCLFQDPPKLLK